MKLHRNLAILLMVGAFSAGLMMGCGSDDAPDDGAGGTSSSSSSRSSSTVSTGSLVVSTTGGGSEAARYLGKRCKADKDCGEDGKCLVEGEDSPLFLGGPAGGYCTKACSEDTDCEGSGSVCVRVSENGNEKQCVLGCTPEDVELEYLNDPLDPYKCQGRDDLSCFQDQFGGGVCLPNCGSDAQCEGDRVCDPRMGVCTSDPTTGLARGSACSYDPNAEEEDSEFPACEGTCIGLVQDEKDIVHGVCSELCTLGGDIMNDCGGLDKGLCLPLYRTASAGDIGMCVIACNAHDDCVMPLTFCYDFGNEDNGYCVDGAEECEDDDSECPRGTVCTETPDGRFCLDDTYPLTAPSSGTGGEGAGGSGTGGDGTGGSGTGGDGTGGSGTGGDGTGGSGTGGDGTGGSGTGGSGTGGSGTGGSGTGGSGTEAVSGAGGSEAVSGAGGGGAGG